MRRLPAVLLLCCTAVGAQTPGQPGPGLSGCPVMPLPEMPDLPPADAADPRIELFTGHTEVDLAGGFATSRDVAIRRGDGVLVAPAARYDRDNGRLTLEGGLRFQDPKTSISGRDAELDISGSELRVKGAEFQLFTVPARGAAESITVRESGTLRLKGVAYTTCAPGDETWLLRAGSIRIDRDLGIATARNARLSFKGVPILYTPWISYPVTNERKSGFLLPNIGRSETRGLEFQIPYYLNLAPNYDATLTPRYMENRGLQMISEFRYLWPGHLGQIDAEYLPDDKARSEDRYLFGITHQSMLGAGWRATLDGRSVSDTRYFEDLYGSVSASSQTHLERVLDFEYLSDRYSVLARFQDFQTLDEALSGTGKPYRRVPQLAFSAFVPDERLGIDWQLDSELTVFDRNAGVTGGRLHLQPAIAVPLAYRGLSLVPRAALQYTAYSLDDTEPGTDDRPRRTAPVLSVDLGAVFERGRPGRAGWLQTLEPRAQYVYIPYRDQDELPVFDTIEPDFNLVQLFRENRFLGHDRLADTSQVNIGITSRLLDAANGAQFITATIGQSRYFADQDVTLPDGSPRRSNRSDWLAELRLNFWDHWRFDLGYQWDADAGQSQRFGSRLQYRRDGRRVANIAYRYRRDLLEEIDVSAAWPLSERWSAVARYDYSLLDNELLERFAGIEYQNCCWGLRVVYRRYLASRTGETDSAIALQLILKGLTNIGDPADRLLERGILGYESD